MERNKESGGSSRITTATVLQETTVGVCRRSVSCCCLVRVMYDILTPCDLISPYYQRISYHHQDKTDVVKPHKSQAFFTQDLSVEGRKPPSILQVIILNKEEKSC